MSASQLALTNLSFPCSIPPSALSLPTSASVPNPNSWAVTQLCFQTVALLTVVHLSTFIFILEYAFTCFECAFKMVKYDISCHCLWQVLGKTCSSVPNGCLMCVGELSFPSERLQIPQLPFFLSHLSGSPSPT